MRLIDADDLLKEIEELKKSPWFNNGRGGCVLHGLYLERKEAVEMVEDICIKQAPTIKTFTLENIEAQYRKGLEKGLEESLEEREHVISWLSKFCLHIDMADKHLSDAEALEFWKKKMKEQFGWKEGEAK